MAQKKPDEKKFTDGETRQLLFQQINKSLSGWNSLELAKLNSRLEKIREDLSAGK